MTQHDQRRFPPDVNTPAVDHPRFEPMDGLFERQVHRTPDAIAVEAGRARLTYAELSQRARQVARALRVWGIGPGSRVWVPGPADWGPGRDYHRHFRYRPRRRMRPGLPVQSST